MVEENWTCVAGALDEKQQTIYDYTAWFTFKGPRSGSSSSSAGKKIIYIGKIWFSKCNNLSIHILQLPLDAACCSVQSGNMSSQRTRGVWLCNQLWASSRLANLIKQSKSYFFTSVQNCVLQFQHALLKMPQTGKWNVSALVTSVCVRVFVCFCVCKNSPVTTSYSLCVVSSLRLSLSFLCCSFLSHLHVKLFHRTKTMEHILPQTSFV